MTKPIPLRDVALKVPPPAPPLAHPDVPVHVIIEHLHELNKRHPRTHPDDIKRRLQPKHPASAAKANRPSRQAPSDGEEE